MNTANSSPPSRATVSDARTQASSRRAASTSSASPAAWPETVVDRLEVVEIEEQQRQRRLAADAATRVSACSRAIAQQRAIGQPGERIVECLVRELGLERRALAHVARVEHNAAHRASCSRFIPMLSTGAPVPSRCHMRQLHGAPALPPPAIVRCRNICTAAASSGCASSVNATPSSSDGWCPNSRAIEGL